MPRSSKYSNRKLSTSLKQEITRKLMQHRFRPLLAAAYTKEASLVARTYEAIYPGTYRRQMANLEKLRPGSFGTRHVFFVSTQGMTVYLGSTTDGCCRIPGLHRGALQRDNLIELPVQYLVPATSGDHRANLNDYDEALAQDVASFLTDHRTLQADINKAEAEAYAAVHSFGSARMLVQGWPEIEPLVKDLLPRIGTEVAPSQLLPAVQLAALNTAFHLPPEKACK